MPPRITLHDRAPRWPGISLAVGYSASSLASRHHRISTGTRGLLGIFLGITCTRLKSCELGNFFSILYHAIGHGN